jgi:hypothetical protein
MVNVNELSPASNTLKAADFDGGEWELTIRSYKVVEFDQQDQKTGETYKQKKPVFSFDETEKTLVCNKTNRNAIAYAYGDEMDDWVGKKVILFGQMVDFGNKQVEGIRVRVPKPMKKPTGPAAKGKFDERNPPPADLDDAIPF